MSVRALSIRTAAEGVRSDADRRFTLLRFPVLPLRRFLHYTALPLLLLIVSFLLPLLSCL